MILIKEIKLERLLLCFLITFLVADTYPHPNLGSGLIQSTFEHIQGTDDFE
ncbi:hypothetical protein H1P_2620003 [Hyella patelloides LEGE 07179]|uniref:Uncharacterized protein n=1 Tax=Hyella patelloides LEGE 07179 TaxID=945734 RepID=A0A563VSK5_9CYAN|nr:hypothetical protein [Hyella patelloides]VEP14312.1 hypothetical protein H1P_2570003 [Hyella patelloides LEGE 07179]VEP14415.1 hypothetical protein H1P_2620003 [Hyella patelloides LEGE 07179]